MEILARTNYQKVVLFGSHVSLVRARPLHTPNWIPYLIACLSFSLPFMTAGSEDDNATIISNTENPSGEIVKKGTVKHALTALGAFLSVRDFGERLFNDLSDTWWMIGIGFILAFILSFTWILLMRWLAGIMVWTSIGLIFVLVSGLFGYSLYRYMMVKDVASSQISILQVNLTPDYLQEVLSLRDTWLAFTCILGIVSIRVSLFFKKKTRLKTFSLQARVGLTRLQRLQSLQRLC